MMRVLAADDHGLVRRGVRDVLAPYGVTVDEASGGNEAIDKNRGTRYDAIILDISFPDRDGLDVLKQIKAEQPTVPVLMVSMHAEKQYAVRALRAGAAGYLMKEAAAEQLWEAVSKVAAGGTYITPTLAEHLADALTHRQVDEPHQRLSDREFQVFRSLGEGKPTREIAEQLGISVKTVHTHRMNVLQKLGLRSNAELIHYAIEHRLV